MSLPLKWAVGDACSVYGRRGTVIRIERSWPMEDGSTRPIAHVWLESTACKAVVAVSDLRLAVEAEEP